MTMSLRNVTRLLLITVVAATILLASTATAENIQRSRTTDGGCALVDWTTNPGTAVPTTGCQSGDPCVYVDWTTVPPTASPSTNCQ